MCIRDSINIITHDDRSLVSIVRLVLTNMRYNKYLLCYKRLNILFYILNIIILYIIIPSFFTYFSFSFVFFPSIIVLVKQFILIYVITSWLFFSLIYLNNFHFSSSLLITISYLINPSILYSAFSSRSVSRNCPNNLLPTADDQCFCSKQYHALDTVRQFTFP